MKKKLPILIVIPHGGYEVPEELRGYEEVSEFDLLYESDVCANELFSFGDGVIATLDAGISRLFVDVDRPHLAVPPAALDGVIKKTTAQGKPVFKGDAFPDDLAIANLIERYYAPFQQTLERIVRTGEVKYVLECHTMMVVAPPGAIDEGSPRPIVTVGNRVNTKKGIVETGPHELAHGLLSAMQREFSGENLTVAEKFTLNRPPFGGYIQERCVKLGIPSLRLSISRSLFFNEKYFSFESLTVDEERILELRDRIWKSIRKAF